MKFLKIALRTFGAVFFVTVSSYFYIVQSSAITSCASGSEKCDYHHQTRKGIIALSRDTDQEIAINSELDIAEIEKIGEPLNDFPEEAELRIFFDSDPLIQTLSSRYRAALLNFQRNLWQYSNVAVIFILALVTAIFVLIVGAFAFLVGPVFTSIVGLFLPFFGFAAVSLVLLLKPTTLISTQQQPVIIG